MCQDISIVCDEEGITMGSKLKYTTTHIYVNISFQHLWLFIEMSQIKAFKAINMSKYLYSHNFL